MLKGLGAALAVPLAALVAKKAKAATVAAPMIVPPPSWFCFTCSVRGDAESADDARCKLRGHCVGRAHVEKLEQMTANQVLKGEIKRRRRDGRVPSGFSAWYSGCDPLPGLRGKT